MSALALSHEFTLPNGIRLAALSQKELTSQPVIAVHGWLDNAASFVPLAASLPDIHWLAVDLAGHGHSSHRSRDATYYLVEYAADLVALCHLHGWKQLDWVGHSMGGMVVTVLAATFPELVNTVVLVDSLGFITTPSHDAVSQLRKAILVRLQSENRNVRGYPELSHAIRARQSVSDFDETTAALLVQRGIAQQGHLWCWRSDKRLQHPSALRFSNEQARSFIKALQCKVFAIMAEQSPTELTQSARDFADDYAQLQTVTLSGGHHLHMTNAEACAQVIRQFWLAQHALAI